MYCFGMQSKWRSFTFNFLLCELIFIFKQNRHEKGNNTDLERYTNQVTDLKNIESHW